MIKTIIYHEITNELRDAWQILWENEATATCFNSPGWFIAAKEAFNIKNEIIVACYKNEKLLGILPLIRERKYAVNFFVSPASKFAHRSSLLGDINNEQFIKALTEKLLQLGNVSLSHLRDEEVTAISNITSHFSVINQDISLQVPLILNEQGELLLSKKEQIIKKARTEKEHISLTDYLTNETDILSTVFSIDMQSMKHTKGYNVFGSEENRKFYTLLKHYLGKFVTVYILYHKGKPAAYEIGFQNKETYLDSERAYLEEHEYYTPGKVIMVMLAEALAKRGIKTLDLGPGIDNFKKSLAKEGLTFSNCVLIKNPLISLYIRHIVNLREKVYAFAFRHKWLYTLYKKL